MDLRPSYWPWADGMGWDKTILLGWAALDGGE